MPPHPKRCLLKISGELLLGGRQQGISEDAALSLAKNLITFAKDGLEVGVVIGGGNLFRGIEATGKVLSRRAGDGIGMLATLMNAVAVQEAFSYLGKSIEIFSGFDCPKLAEKVYMPRVLESLKQSGIVLFAGGTGNPFFTTDTAAVLRAGEINADVLIKATKVPFVYDRDPVKDPAATPFQEITTRACLEKQLKFMDATALSLAENLKLDLFVCDMSLIGARPLKEIFGTVNQKTGLGTWVKSKEA